MGRRKLSHIARAHRYRGRQAEWDKNEREEAERAAQLEELARRRQGVTQAQLELRKLEHLSRLRAASDREYREWEKRDLDRLIILARKLLEERIAALAEWEKIMRAAPVPKADRKVRHRAGSDDHPEFGSRPPAGQAKAGRKREALKKAETDAKRRLNGLT